MKKLIVLATLAALPAVAMADVTISGNIGVVIDNVKNGSGVGSTNNMKSQDGNIKFSGSEDLGNGLKAIWAYDHAFDTSEGTQKDNEDESTIGLVGNFGTVKFGRQKNAMRQMGTAMADVNMIYDVFGIDQDSVYRSALRKRINNGVAYYSPEFAGLTFGYSYGQATDRVVAADGKVVDPDADTPVHITDSSHENNVAVKYKLNDMVTLAYAGNFTKNTDSEKTDKAHEVDAAFTFGDLGFNVGYAWDKSYDGANADAATKRKGLATSATYTIGQFTPYIGFYKQWDSKTEGKTNADTGYKAYSIGTYYALSKRTTAGVEYVKVSSDDVATRQKGVAVALTHSF